MIHEELNDETQKDRLERIRASWQGGLAIGSPNSQMRKIQDDFCFVLRLLDSAASGGAPAMVNACIAWRAATSAGEPSEEVIADLYSRMLVEIDAWVYAYGGVL